MAANASLSLQNGSLTNTTYMASLANKSLLSPQAYELLVNIFFSFIIIIGLIGNSLVIAAVWRWKEMRTTCNMFLLNIAVADVLLTMVGGSLRIIELYHGWVFGEFLCHFLAPMQDVFVSVSGITHSTIAWERYRATVTPFKPRLSKTKAKRLLPAIWIISYVACGLPLAVKTQLQSGIGYVAVCLPVWSALYRRIYEVYLVGVFIALQLLVQTYAYSKIIITLRTKNELFRDSTSVVCTKGDADNENTNDDLESRISTPSTTRKKKKSKTIKILIVLVVVFQVCYIPRGIVMLITEFSTNLPAVYRYVVLISLILYYLKHVLNPFILFLMSAEFKTALRNIVLCQWKNRCNLSDRFTLQTSHAQICSSGARSIRRSDEDEDVK